MSRRFRPILPTPVTLSSSPASQPSGASARTQVVRRRRSQAACEHCRVRKIACDGIRPSCAPCRQRHVDCIYKPRPRENLAHLQNHANLLERLISDPEPEALELLRHLRATSNASAVLASLHGSMHQRLRPSDLAAARSMSPPTSSELEFELASLHPYVYPKLLPLDISSSAGTASRQRTNPRIAPSDTGEFIPSPIKGVFSKPISLATGPHRPQRLCDDRLHRLQIGYWTGVPVSNDFAACAISSYFVRDHRLLGLFDADIFIDDLVERRQEFCSPFLLTSLMYYACHLYAAIDIRALAIAKPFLAEAKRLWQAERLRDSLTTVAGIQVLCIMMNGQSRDKECLEWLIEGRRMAERMSLFGAPHSDATVAHFGQWSERAKRATAHTAWGIYNWMSLHDSFYLECEPIPFPPVFPIPGEHKEAEVLKLGVTWPSHPLPDYVGSSFSMFCRFWSIMQEVSAVYNCREDTLLTRRISIAFAESKYQKLLDWSDSLGHVVADWEHDSSHILLFYMYFHGGVITIFRPFQHHEQSLQLASFSSHDSSPAAAFSASLNQLKRLVVRLHCERSPWEHSLFLSTILIYIFNGILQNPSDKECNSCFTLCMVLCSQLFTWYRVIGPIMQGTFSMALRDGAVSSNDAHEQLENYMTMGRSIETFETSESAAFSLDFGLAMTAPEEALTDSLARQFEELAVFAELINVNDVLEASDGT